MRSVELLGRNVCYVRACGVTFSDAYFNIRSSTFHKLRKKIIIILIVRVLHILIF